MIRTQGQRYQGCGHTQEKGVKTQQEGSLLQAEQRGLRRNEPRQHFDLGLTASGMLTDKISIVKATQSVVFCNHGSSKLIQPLRNK